MQFESTYLVDYVVQFPVLNKIIVLEIYKDLGRIQKMHTINSNLKIELTFIT